MRNVKRRPIFLLRVLMVALLCSQAPFSVLESKALTISADGLAREEQVSSSDGRMCLMADEPQSPACLFARGSSSRLGSSRPFRLLPTHGGRPVSHSGRSSLSSSYNHLLAIPRHVSLSHYCARLSAASRRLYYVIAMRRLLC